MTKTATQSHDDQVQKIVASTYTTGQLIARVLSWDTTSPEIIAGAARRIPVWEATCTDKAGAEDLFYNGITRGETDQDLRYYAAEALVAGGWTLRAINQRNS